MIAPENYKAACERLEYEPNARSAIPLVRLDEMPDARSSSNATPQSP